ncbi:MAG: Holliday junction resolvase RuvX [Clostridiales bacterium]|jgi:putative Holliday junction resolvase|nr:Holliday junction resolvase RuvX [Clostridiales bacterium]
MARILGLDYGDRSIGVAVSDELNIAAHGVEVIRGTDERSVKKSVARIRDIIKIYDARLIALGYPLNMNGSEGERCEKTLLFKQRLERNFHKIPVELWDERLSSVWASRVLAGDKRSGDKIDKIAAIYILQGYLDYRKKASL